MGLVFGQVVGPAVAPVAWSPSSWTTPARQRAPTRSPGCPTAQRWPHAWPRCPAPLAGPMIDLDHFKTVNDALGHDTGDRVLATTAHRLADALPGAMLARLGGDEFAAILPVGPSQALHLLQHAVAAVARPQQARGLDLTVGASAGVTAAEPGLPAAEVMRRADTALYQAKKTRGRAAAWTPGIAAPIPQPTNAARPVPPRPRRPYPSTPDTPGHPSRDTTVRSLFLNRPVPGTTGPVRRHAGAVPARLRGDLQAEPAVGGAAC
ncbi:GGDEF domain-containing protein [Catellatospora sp. NPDC049609]|uniref:GGDEF domain-containing protein n=1 Tax=Catellatospora sp. NPDC049609 TaxID=3155505 RepID=UPI0034278746